MYPFPVILIPAEMPPQPAGVNRATAADQQWYDPPEPNQQIDLGSGAMRAGHVAAGGGVDFNRHIPPYPAHTLGGLSSSLTMSGSHWSEGYTGGIHAYV
jgi:hypothetical protein